jgi:uncharacterized protein (TIGR03435 family)
MRRPILITTCLALYQVSSFAQSSSVQVEFEAASVKKSDPANTNVPTMCRGGPGSTDPVLFTCVNTALGALITDAYEVQRYELIAPVWMKMGGSVDGYDLSAKVPAGATKEQLQLMVRKLLEERFHLAVHREARNVDRYTLIAGKGKPKLNAPVEKPPNGRPYTSQFVGGHIHFVTDRISMKGFAGFLTNMVNAPVEDQTNLSGEFAFTFDLAPDDRWPFYSPALANLQKGDTTPDVITALQEQLGLKLESKKGPLEVLVVDHADKIPSEN